MTWKEVIKHIECVQVPSHCLNQCWQGCGDLFFFAVWTGYQCTRRCLLCGPTEIQSSVCHEPTVGMMTSSNGNIFRVTGRLCGEFTGPGEFPTQRPVTRSFDFSLICVSINGWVNNREAGDLRRYRAHYDVIVMGINGLFGATKTYHE